MLETKAVVGEGLKVLINRIYVKWKCNEEATIWFLLMLILILLYLVPKIFIKENYRS